MKDIMAWMKRSATLNFDAAVPVRTAQNDPRLSELFDALRNAPDESAAQPIEDRIWMLWSESGIEDIDKLMALGVAAMGVRDFTTADAVLTTIVEKAPGFAEGWNKRATLYYMMGKLEKSEADAEKTLALEPRHFGALSGLGMIRLAQDDERGALEAFERALAIHPHMVGATTHIRKLRLKLRGRATRS